MSSSTDHPPIESRPTDDAVDPDESGDGTLTEAEIEELRGELTALVDDTRPTVTVEPIVHIQSRTRVGGEALTRFPGPASTRDWFRAARALGLEADLELRIIAEVVRSAGDGHGFISINVSPRTVVDERCLSSLTAAVRADHVEFVVEMTCHESMPGLAVVRPHLDALRDAGVRVGVHVSSFGRDTSRLLELTAPDVIKLDPPLVATILAGTHDETAVDALFSYGRQHGVFVVAVGASSDDDLRTLGDAGADAAQGRSLDLG